MSQVNDYLRTQLESVRLSDRDPVWGRQKARLRAVTNALRDILDVRSARVIGSFARGSAIKRTSDLDVLVVLKANEMYWGDKLKQPATVLENVRERLKDSYDRSDVRVDTPAVTIGFGGGRERVDVVPACFAGMVGSPSRPVFWIPSDATSWIQTSPETHAEYIRRADAACGGQLRGVAQLMKRWRQNADVDLSSFHLELLLAKETVGRGVVSYADCLHAAFRLLALRSCRALQDPCGLSGLVPAARSQTAQRRLLAAVRRATTMAREAACLAADGRLAEEKRVWARILTGSR